MAKQPFKNLSSPSSNTNESPKAPVLPKEWDDIEDRTKNGEPLASSQLRDGEKPIAWPAAENGSKPMRIKNGG